MILPEALKRPFENLQAVVPLNPADVVHTTDPAVIGRLFPLGRALYHFASTEKATDDYLPQLMTMHPNSPLHRLILPIWHSHEIPHGEAHDNELKALGLPPGREPTGQVPAAVRMLGILAGTSDHFDIGLQIASVGTALSHETAVAATYPRMKAEYIKRGAREYAETALTLIGSHEGFHVAMYKPWLEYLLAHASRVDKWLGRQMLMLSWQPVGTKKQAQRADVGAVGVDMLGEQGARDVGDIVYRRMDRILKSGEGTLPHYMQRRMKKAMDLYRDEASQLHRSGIPSIAA